MEQRIRDLERILKKKDEELAFEKLRCRAMDTLIEELKGKLISLLNLTGVTPETFDESARLVGGDLGID